MGTSAPKPPAISAQIRSTNGFWFYTPAPFRLARRNMGNQQDGSLKLNMDWLPESLLTAMQCPR
jgi:hypothetical protein